MPTTPLLSIVIPVYNEREVLPQCYSKVSDVLGKLGKSYELVFVDDGSTDGSGEYLGQLAKQNPSIRVIYLSRNFGKEASMTAGIDYAIGDAVIFLDADLQDPPELIPQMVSVWEKENVDVVAMRRRSREGETIIKRATAYWFYRILNWISDFEIPTDTGDFRLMSRKAIAATKHLPERNRYMKGIFSWIGMDKRIIDYDRNPRAAGKAQQNYLNLLNLAVQGITSFSVAPLRLAVIFGLFAAVFGAMFGLWIIAKAMFFGDPVQGYPSLVAIVTFLGGTQLFTIGILGEYVGKTYIESKQRPNYLIKNIQSSENLPETSISNNDVAGDKHAQ